jgi:hypothetical protein
VVFQGRLLSHLCYTSEPVMSTIMFSCSVSFRIQTFRRMVAHGAVVSRPCQRHRSILSSQPKVRGPSCRVPRRLSNRGPYGLGPYRRRRAFRSPGALALVIRPASVSGGEPAPLPCPIRVARVGGRRACFGVRFLAGPSTFWALGDDLTCTSPHPSSLGGQCAHRRDPKYLGLFPAVMAWPDAPMNHS